MPIRSVNEIKSDYSLLKHSSKVDQEIKCQSETMKDHPPPKVTEPRSQLELLSTTSDTIIIEQIQNVKACKDTIMVNIFMQK